MLVHITPKNLGTYWELMKPGIERALLENNSYKSWDIESVYDQLHNAQAFGFYLRESGVSGVYTLVEHPLRNLIYVYWAGQHPDNKATPDWEEVDAYLVAIAKTVGASSILIEGRKGWVKKLDHLGYSLETVNLTKEVT